MRSNILAFIFFLFRLTGFAQYHPVDKESSVHFTIKNFGFNVGGSLSGLDGNIRFNPDSLPVAHFDISLDAASINTDNDMRDGHLRDDEYLDAKNHPRILFVSESISSRRRDEYLMKGKLTIKNKTKQISFPFHADPAGNGYIFTGSFKINRRDFEVGGSSTLSDDLTVNLKVAVK